MNELALFAGAGGGILGGKLLGWRTVCAVEWEPYPASVLVARQNDGILPPFPVWDDVQTFDGRPWRGIVDVVSGGFPCQDISAAGKGAGIDGERSGMWREMARIIHEVRPRFAFVENSPMLTTRGLGTVLADLAAMGFDARWGVLGAADVGANHQRNRIWIVGKQMADTINPRQLRTKCLENNSPSQRGRESQDDFNQKSKIFGKNANASCSGLERQRSVTSGIEQELGNISDKGWWQFEPNVGRVADGVAARVDRLKAIGNGQVPQCAAKAWELLSEMH
jgi:DNA (cytosine-5)-methyltransferase 1